MEKQEGINLPTPKELRRAEKKLSDPERKASEFRKKELLAWEKMGKSGHFELTGSLENLGNEEAILSGEIGGARIKIKVSGNRPYDRNWRGEIDDVKISPELAAELFNKLYHLADLGKKEREWAEIAAEELRAGKRTIRGKAYKLQG